MSKRNVLHNNISPRVLKSIHRYTRPRKGRILAMEEDAITRRDEYPPRRGSAIAWNLAGKCIRDSASDANFTQNVSLT